MGRKGDFLLFDKEYLQKTKKTTLWQILQLWQNIYKGKNFPLVIIAITLQFNIVLELLFITVEEK